MADNTLISNACTEKLKGYSNLVSIKGNDSMSIPMNSPEILDREFFEIRAKILEIAAAFDRLDRSIGDVSDDSRLKLVEEALSVLQQQNRQDRAEQVQLIFSREYNDQWQETFGISSEGAATSSN